MSDAVELVPWLKDRRLTVMAGAGVSIVAPSCLPSWWQLNHAVLDAIASIGAPATDAAREITEAIKQKQDDGRMPPEYTSEVIADLLDDDYFEVLRAVEGERTNAVHHWLAALGKSGRLPAIVTTNFDTLIERAFAAAEAPLRVLVHAEEYEALDVAALVSDPRAPTVLLKLHGTATEPTTALDTLAHRKLGLAEPVAEAVRALLQHTRWCLMGYSGADIEADPNYLFLRQMAARDTPGIDWLVQPSREPLPAVREVVEAYGPDRGAFRTGTLPGWLGGWIEALAGTGVMPKSAVPIDESVARAEGQQKLTEGVESWARTVGPGACGLVLLNLAERLHPTLADRAATETLAWMERNTPGTRHHGLALMYRARHHQQASRSAEAAATYRQAVEVFEAVGAVDALASVLNEYSHVLSHVGRLSDAEAALRQCIAISDQLEEPTDTVVPSISLANVLAHQGEIDQAMGLARGAIERARVRGDEPTRALALEHTAKLLRDTGHAIDALQYYQDAELVRRRLGHDKALAYNLTHQATIHTNTASFDVANEKLDEAQQLATQIGHLGVRATVAMTRSGVSAVSGDYPAAIRQLRAAAGLRQQAGDLIGELEVRGNLVGMLAAQGDHAAAIAEGTEALAAAEELSVPSQVADLSGNLGLAYEMAGQLDEAVRHYHRSVDVARAVGNRSTEANATGNLGNVHYRRGEIEPAAEAYERSIGLARELDEPAIVVRTLGNLGNIRMQQGRLEDASAAYEEALSLAAEHGLEGITAHVHLNLGFVRMNEQNWEQAAVDLGRAREGFVAQGDPGNAGLSALYGGQCLAQLGHAERARDEVQGALEHWAGLDHEREAEARAWLTHLSQAT